MKRLLILAHAPSPNTVRLRDAALEGARHPDIESVAVDVAAPLETGPDAVLAADAVLLGTPENLGYMSGALKDFFDRAYHPLLERTQGLPYALYVRAGQDGTGARRAVESIGRGLRWRTVQKPEILRGDWDEAFVERCRDLGQLMAAGLDASVF